MATTTTKTNKPILPRGADNRPVDSYNRAELYSGKALDFDGVNDHITISNSDSINITGDALTIAGYINTDGSSAWQGICYKDGGNNKGFQLFVDKTGDPNIAFGIHTGGFYRLYSNEVIENNKWYFVVATYDGVNQSIYLNGVFDNSQAATGNITDSSAENLYIGRNTGGSERFNGEMSGFKIFNTALTAAQVADLYNNPEKIVPTGVSDSALKLWLPMMEGAGTTCINGAPDAIGSELVTNGDFASNINDWAAKDCTIVWDNGKIKCDNSSGNGGGGPRQNVGLQNSKTYRFTATIQLISASANGTFGIFTSSAGGTGQSTVYTGSTLVAGGDAITEIGEFTTGTDGDVSIQFYVDRANAVFTVDNVSVKEISNNGTISGATWTHGIGAPVAQTAVIDWNKHTLDGTNEVLIPQGLTSGRDLLGNLFENVRKQGALNLDGNSWAEVHDNASLDFGTGSFTLEAWVKADFLSQGSGVNIILSLGGDITSANNSGLVSTSSAFSFWIGGINRFTPAYVSESWNHIVGVRSGSSVIFYFNGAQVATGSSSSSITNSQEKQIGRDETTIRYYPNQIAQPRIYNRALTASEVLNNYNATKTLYI